MCFALPFWQPQRAWADETLLPMTDPSTSVGLSPLSTTAPTATWMTLSTGLVEDWWRLRSHYELYRILAAAGGAHFRLELPWRWLRAVGLGGQFTLPDILLQKVVVEPAIRERYVAGGTGNLVLWTTVQIVDERLSRSPPIRVTAGVWLRAVAPTTTLVRTQDRYPLVPWRLVLGPNSDQGALIELPGLTADLSMWHGLLQVQLGWVPLIWGAVRNGPDRFLTSASLQVGSRPWQRGPTRRLELRAVDVAVQVRVLGAMNDPVYTDPVRAGSVGAWFRLWFGYLGIAGGVHYGFGTPRTGYGEWLGTVELTFLLEYPHRHDLVLIRPTGRARR